MSNLITLKRRISSIKSTKQITRAMQMVAASKLKKAQEYSSKSKEYYNLAVEMINHISNIRDVQDMSMYSARPLNQHLYIVITSNSGLAGAYNANILKLFNQSLKTDKDNKIKSKVIIVGNRGAQYVRRIADIELLSVYNDFADQPTANELRPILNHIINLYNDQEVDRVDLIYTEFITNLYQRAKVTQLLPVIGVIKDKTKDNKMIVSNFEPDVETVIDQVTIRLIEALLFQAMLDSIAAEQSMRMMAMKNATDNAKDLIEDYSLEYNKARQAGITQELAEITGGAEALND